MTRARGESGAKHLKRICPRLYRGHAAGQALPLQAINRWGTAPPRTRRSSMGSDLFVATGFVGVAIVLFIYFANQQRWLSSEDWRFPFANALGSALILFSLVVQWNFPSFIINCVWIAISIYGLIKGIRAKRAH
jgi:paired small multidrug resistance pump